MKADSSIIGGVGMVAVLVAGLGVALGAGLMAVMPAAARPLGECRIMPAPPPLVQFAGHDSRITTARLLVVRDDSAWKALWSEHTGDATPAVPPRRHRAPIIDFSRCMVVASFAGTTRNRDGRIASSVHETDEEVRLRVVDSSFQTAGFGEDPGVRTTPFGMWVIPASNKPIIIERPVYSSKGEIGGWVEDARIE